MGAVGRVITVVPVALMAQAFMRDPEREHSGDGGAEREPADLLHYAALLSKGVDPIYDAVFADTLRDTRLFHEVEDARRFVAEVGADYPGLPLDELVRPRERTCRPTWVSPTTRTAGARTGSATPTSPTGAATGSSTR